MFYQIGIITLAAIIFGGCVTVPDENMKLTNDFDGKYTLEVQCGKYKGTTTNFVVSSGKITGSIAMVQGTTPLSGYVEKDGTISGRGKHVKAPGLFAGEVTDWENRSAEGDVHVSGEISCEGVWKIVQIAQQTE